MLWTMEYLSGNYLGFFIKGRCADGSFLSIYYKVFFFQAEDGIRDTSVTGGSDVCSSDLHDHIIALWQFGGEASTSPSPPLGAERVGVRWGICGAAHLTFPSLRDGPSLSPLKGGEGEARSEERRVGKEWGWRGSGRAEEET